MSRSDPVVLVAGAYIGGILLGRYLPGLCSVRAAVGGALLLLLLFYALPQRRRLLLSAAPFLLAGLLAWSAAMAPGPPWVSELSGWPVALEGTIIDEPLQLPQETRYRVAVRSIAPRGGDRAPARGVVEVRLANPAAEEVLLFGERLRLSGRLLAPSGPRNPGGFDYLQFARARGLDALVFVWQTSALQAAGPGEAGGWPAAALNLRARLLEAAADHLPPDQAALLSGMLFGLRQRLPPEVEGQFRAAGLAHLLAVSGLHLGLLAAMLVALARRLRLPAPWTLPAVLPLVLLYIALTGFRPSTLRAGVMIALALGALSLGRQRHMATALALAALVTLVINPLWLFTPGFQLSYAATLAIVYLTAPLMRCLALLRLPLLRLHAPLAAILAAQLGVWPLTAFYFGQVSLVAVGANLLAIPLLAPVIALGLTALVAGLVSPLLASLLHLANQPLLSALLLIARLGRLPLAYIDLAPGNIAIPIAAYTALAGGALLFNYRPQLTAPVPELRSRSPALLLAPLLIPLAVYLTISLWPPAPVLEVTFLDCGQGDAAFIETPHGHHILIDGGPGGEGAGSGERALVPFLRHRGVDRLQLVVVSHPHEDHCGGLLAVFEHFPVEMLVTGRQAGTIPAYSLLLRRAAARGTELITAGRSDRISLGPDLYLQVHSPPQDLFQGTENDENNNSLVLSLHYGATSFLFTGDIEEAALHYLLRQGGPGVGVLKVPHHGAFAASLPAFIEQLSPSLAVISVGPNSFGHPDLSTLQALRAAGVDWRRTDHHGAVIVQSDGQRLSWRTMLSPDAVP